MTFYWSSPKTVLDDTQSVISCRTWPKMNLEVFSDMNNSTRPVRKWGPLHFREQKHTVVIPPRCSSRKPQPVHGCAMNFCLAEDCGASEQDTKTSFAKSVASGRKVTFGIVVRLT